MGEVKGGIVIEQLKKYAKKLSDHTGNSAMVQIDVWCHKYEDDQDFYIDIKAYDCHKNQTISPRYKTEDLRELGAAIDDYIRGGKNEKTR